MKKKDITAWVVISDTHIGSQLGLCPESGIMLDEGGMYYPNEIQKALWIHWQEFWKKKVPEMTEGMPYGLIFNGDLIEGVHHSATCQVSSNIKDHILAAEQILSPLVDKARGPLYVIRGTPAHVGTSGANEEELARILGAIPNSAGQYARYELWKRIGPFLAHFTHHISTVGSQYAEATAVHRELMECFTEAARHGEEIPDIVVRSHRHRYVKTEVATYKGTGIGVTTPAWQAKTGFVYKIAARNNHPQFGGIVILVNKKGELEIRKKVWSPKRGEIE